MESLRQIGAGFLLSVLSLTVVLGGFSLSQAESGLANYQPTFTPAPTQAPVTVLPTLPILTQTPLPSLSPLKTVTAEPTLTSAPTLTQLPTQTPPPPPVSCPPPSGWMAVQIQPGMTLLALAQSYQTSPELLKQKNCLFSDQLAGGSYLYVPPLPTATLIPCGPPPGWINYPVLPGDTLFNIGLRYRVSVTALQKANCLGGSTFIKAGTLIKVPNVVPLVSTATPVYPTAIPTLTQVPATATQVPPTALPTTSLPTSVPPTDVPPTLTLPPSATPVTPPPTLTSVPAATETPLPSSTPVPPGG